jgi:hypothetical protein
MRGEISKVDTIVVDAATDFSLKASEVLINGTTTLDGHGCVYPPTSVHSVIGLPGSEHAVPISENAVARKADAAGEAQKFRRRQSWSRQASSWAQN